MITKFKNFLKKIFPFFISRIDGVNFKKYICSINNEQLENLNYQTYKDVFLHVPTGTVYKKNVGIVSQSKIGYGRIRKTGLINSLKPDYLSIQSIDYGSTIYCNSSNSGFYHWLIECLPRAQFLSNNTPVYLPELSPLNQEILNYIYPNLNVIITKSNWLHFKQFKLPLFFAKPGKGIIPVNFRKKILSKLDATLNIDILFISRDKASKRRLLNETDLIERISKFKLIKVCHLETISFAEQLEIINRSKLIIAPHGAGLSNIIASSDNSSILEILSSDERPMEFYKCLSNSIGINYKSFLIENKVSRHSDYYLSDNDINEIYQFVQTLFGK